MIKIKCILLGFIFCIVDIILFIYFQNEVVTFRSKFWIGHFLLVILFIYITSKFSKDRQFDIFILIFPIVGYLLFITNQILFFRKYFNAEVEINDDLEKYILNEEKEIIVNQSIDLNLIGAYDILSVGTPMEKKSFLIGFETQNLSFKVQVLKKALWDSDIEVIHYAATEINKIDENFQKLIKEKKLEKDLNSLCNIYFDYCTSGLLVGEVLEFYQLKFIEHVKEKEILDVDDYYKLLAIYSDMKEYGVCNKLISQIKESKKYNIDILNFIKKYYYNLNDYKMLKEVEKWQESV